MTKPSRSLIALSCAILAGVAHAACSDDAPGGAGTSAAAPTASQQPDASTLGETAAHPDRPPAILIFSKTAAFRHASIPVGVDALRALGEERGWVVEHTEDAGDFTDEGLAGFDAVVFLSTTGDVLDEDQQAAFERYIALGRGYAGIHSAADTEYDWEWYGLLVGAYFKSHPSIQDAVVIVEDPDHPSTAHLGPEWPRRDEWYDYRTNPRSHTPDGEPVDGPRDDDGAPRIRILASMLVPSYQGSTMGPDHPIAWCHEFDGGRAWYTGGGHTSESFADPEFLEHLAGGIEWAAGWADE